jgi:hypothetical protein
VSTGDGRWNFTLLHNLVPSSIIQKMHAIVLPHDSYGEDVQLWPGNRAGNFTVSVAYHLITREMTYIVDKTWTRVWKIDCIERIKVFIWQLIHDRLLTKAKLARWHLGDPFCVNCIHFEESIIHLFVLTVSILKNLLSMSFVIARLLLKFGDTYFHVRREVISLLLMFRTGLV